MRSDLTIADRIALVRLVLQLTIAVGAAVAAVFYFNDFGSIIPYFCGLLIGDSLGVTSHILRRLKLVHASTTDFSP